MHLYSYHKIYISVWHGALGRAGRGVEEQSKALRSGVPGEGHPRSGPARLPWVPSTPPLTWVPCGLPHLSPGLDLSPLKSGLCPAVVPSSAARGGLGLGGGGGRWGGGCDGLGAGSSPCCLFRDPPAGTGGRGHWGGGAVPTPPVSQLRGCSALPLSLFTWGGGWRRRVPRATRVTRAPCPPLPAKCCVSSVGVDLRYHLVAALPSRGHRCPRLSARVPAPCGRLARDSNSPRSPNPGGDGPAAHHPCQDRATWGFVPQKLVLA